MCESVCVIENILWRFKCKPNAGGWCSTPSCGSRCWEIRNRLQVGGVERGGLGVEGGVDDVCVCVGGDLSRLYGWLNIPPPHPTPPLNVNLTHSRRFTLCTTTKAFYWIESITAAICRAGRRQEKTKRRHPVIRPHRFVGWLLHNAIFIRPLLNQAVPTGPRVTSGTSRLRLDYLRTNGLLWKQDQQSRK